jgi:hypothetical protein
MPFIQDNFRLATLVIANNPTGGVIGTAATTVDVASAFNINQTTAAQALTLPTPTIADAGLLVKVTNVGTVSYTLNGVAMPINATTEFVWNGAAYVVDPNIGRNAGAVVVAPTLTAGNNTVTHNLNLPAGSFSSLDFTARNSTGQEVAVRRVTASDTANSMVINVVSASATPTTFYIVPLA